MKTLLDTVPQRALAQLPEMTKTALARRRLGGHQYEILTNRARWSLADLAGRARKYGLRYKIARNRAMRDLRDLLASTTVKVRVEPCTGPTGRALGIVWVWE